MVPRSVDLSKGSIHRPLACAHHSRTDRCLQILFLGPPGVLSRLSRVRRSVPFAVAVFLAGAGVGALVIVLSARDAGKRVIARWPKLPLTGLRRPR